MHIPMEEELIGMLIGGFSIVMIITLSIVVVFWFKNKSSREAYSWIVAHFILFTIAIIIGLSALLLDLNNPSYSFSETFSKRIGMAGIFWAISNFCLLNGIIKLDIKARKVEEKV